MQKTDSNQSGVVAHRKMQTSAGKSRKNMKRPALMSESVQAPAQPQQQMNVAMQQMSQAQQPTTAPMPAMPIADMYGIHAKMRARTTAPAQPQKQTAKEIKQQAISKALANAARKPQAQSKAMKKKSAQKTKFHFGLGRIVLALGCAVAAVVAIVYFVNLNSPDISLKVAAMQTGIEAKYPNYVPRDYSLSDITSEEGKVTLNFANAATGGSYTIIEEKSSWDSNALLSNYVKKAYGDNYTVMRENGLTLYVSNSDAAWVNGGVVFKLECKSGSLTKKQIRSIAVSL